MRFVSLSVIYVPIHPIGPNGSATKCKHALNAVRTIALPVFVPPLAYPSMTFAHLD